MSRVLFFLVKALTAAVPGKLRRRRMRQGFRSFVYGWQARRRGRVGRAVQFVGPTRVNRKTAIGDACVICGLSVSGDGALTIGRNCQFAPDVLVMTQNHDYDDGDAIPYGDESHEKPVVVEDFVWIGQRVTILPGTVIREGAIVQAGAVVHGEVPACAIVGGNPAKPFMSRDVERFNRFKAAGRYRGGAADVRRELGS